MNWTLVKILALILLVELTIVLALMFASGGSLIEEVF